MQGGGAGSWKALLEVTRAAAAQDDPPLVWGTDVVTCIHELANPIGLPSVDLAPVLVTCLFNATSTNSNSAVWSYIHHAMSCQMVSVLHMLALLTARFVATPILLSYHPFR